MRASELGLSYASADAAKGQQEVVQLQAALQQHAREVAAVAASLQVRCCCYVCSVWSAGWL